MFQCQHRGCPQSFKTHHGRRIHEVRHCMYDENEGSEHENEDSQEEETEIISISSNSDDIAVLDIDEEEVDYNSFPNDHDDFFQDDDHGIDAEDMKYIHYQESFYLSCYSLEALTSTDLNSFLAFLPEHTPTDYVCIQLIQFKRQAGLSRKSGNALLNLIRLFRPEVEVPTDWGTVTRYVNKKCAYLRQNKLKEDVPFPETWNMQDWNEVVTPPRIRENWTRDVYEMLAYKMVCPVIQYMYKKDVSFEARSTTLSDGTPCVTNLMTSAHMVHTQAATRACIGLENAICVPLIVYADGVALGVRNKVKATAVMCTYGIFSDALQQKDISKTSLGYINDLSDQSKELLCRHLCTHGPYSKTNAEKAVAAFGRKIERDFWLLLFEVIIKYQHTGVRMHVLGQGIRTVIIHLAFFVGDDPAIHRYCGLYEGNALRTCVRCLYSLRRNGLFIPDDVDLRSHTEMVALTTQGEVAQLRKEQALRLSAEQKITMDRLKELGVHPLPQCCDNVPMGLNTPETSNTVLNTPPDTLHTWCCGIMRNVLLWTVSIIMNMSKFRGYEQNRGLFDSRVASFRHLPKLPNVTTTYFRGGITCISKNKTSKQRQATTGGAAGYRSCEFVPALIFTSLAIGFKGDVVPTSSTFTISATITVGNITKIIQSCISTMLDAYFEVLASPLTAERIANVQLKLNKMSLHFMSLWQVMNKVAQVEKITLPASRKLHAAVCTIVPAMKLFGSVYKMDTESYESIHRIYTVGAWQQTSKRTSSMHVDMFNQSTLINHSITNEFLEAILSGEIKKFQKERGPYEAPDNVLISPIGNMRHYPMLIDANNDLYVMDEDLPQLILHSEIPVSTMSTLVRRFATEDGWQAIIRKEASLTLLQGVTIEGNEDSKAGKVHLYSTECFPSGGPRYDFVYVHNEGGDDQPAMLLSTFELSTNNRHVEYFALVSYLQLCHKKYQPLPGMKSPMKAHCWELHNDPSNPRRLIRSIQVIHLDCIIGPAWVTPIFDRGHKYNLGRRSDTRDKFWFLHRKYCDRADWDDSYDVVAEDAAEDMPVVELPTVNENTDDVDNEFGDISTALNADENDFEEDEDEENV